MARSNFLDYTAEDRENPEGTNTLSSEATYFQRSLYREVIYPSNVPAPLDTWYGKIYFGKIDKVQNSITVRQENLKPITVSVGTNIYALNCMVDAFQDFSSHMRQARLESFLSSVGNPALQDVKAQKAYEDPTRAYNNFTTTFFNAFNSKIPPPQKRKIKDFQSFLSVYTEYLKKVAGALAVTKTTFILSREVDIYSSGMAISVESGNPSKDDPKYTNFLNDPNFAFYARSAKKFGLLVNKNLPWILTLDLFSNAALKYITNYYTPGLLHGLVNKENFFWSNYIPTYLTDIEKLRTILVNSYIAFVAKNPFIEERHWKPLCNAYGVVLEDRLPRPASALRTELTDAYMLDLYLHLRHREAQSPFSLTARHYSHLKSVYAAASVTNLTPLQNAASWINSLFRDYIYGRNYLQYAEQKDILHLLSLDIGPSFDTITSTGPSLGGAPPMGGTGGGGTSY